MRRGAVEEEAEDGGVLAGSGRQEELQEGGGRGGRILLQVRKCMLY